MTLEVPPNFERLNRRTWSLWVAAFALILSLTVAVPFLYVPLLDSLGADEAGGFLVRNGSTAGLGLAVLAVIFCLHVIVKQRELMRIRERLISDEQDLQNARTRLSEMSALFQLSTTLNLQLQLSAILEIIVRRVIATLKAQQASIMIYNPETGQLETRASYGLESEFARHATARMGHGIAGWVAQRRLSVLLGPKAPSQEIGAHYKSNRNITSALSLPLSVGDRCLGVLNVNRINHPEQFTEHHRDMLRLFAEHVGAVIERADAMDRLCARTQVLESANVKLSELNRLKDVFLSTASHELKTPLTSVIAYSELLDEHGVTLTPQQRSEFLARLQNEAKRLLALIDDILDVSRLETGKMVLRRQRLSINDIASTALETSEAMAQKHGVVLQSRLDANLAPVEADEVKMRQVVVNLLVNAIKFSPRGSTVTLVTRADGDFVVVDVEDHGPGVQPEETVHIFELFGQGLGDHEGRSTGLGMGLHLVRRITELHGGHVGVNSLPGSGSTFWVRLPVQGSAAAPADEPAASQAA